MGLPFPSIKQQMTAIDIIARVGMFTDEKHQISPETIRTLRMMIANTDEEAAMLIASMFVRLAQVAISAGLDKRAGLLTSLED